MAQPIEYGSPYSIRLKPDLDKRLKDASAKAGVKRAQFIRLAVLEKLQREAKQNGS